MRDEDVPRLGDWGTAEDLYEELRKIEDEQYPDKNI